MLQEYMDSNKYIEHLLTQLEEQHKSLWREKLSVARLQREVAQRRNERAMHEKLIHELEEEKHLRLQSEKKLQEVTLESERNRIQMRGLQQQFSRMEETVRNLLQNQGPPEHKKEETVNIMIYQERLSEEVRKHKEALENLHMVADEDSRSESSSTDEGKEKTKLLLRRLKILEAENSALVLENENQRQQYERCLDEVANQVVQALLTQKDLREECVKLKTRVFDLEQQNRTLSFLFQQQVKPTSDLLLQECRLNAKSEVPALKYPGLGVVIPGHLCPRNSCSSSELSLSSTCSEYSSGSSYTWHSRKSFRKRKSSQKCWDKRLSIDSSLPTGFAGPTDELPPTCIKESHILEGLRELQKRKVLLEPPSVITKWGYKDCMNSNEGIYSPGIKSSSLTDYLPNKSIDLRSPCRESQETFVYDTESHHDACEDTSSLALLQAMPNHCRLHTYKLTHSISDSLFGWEPNGKYFSEGTSSVYPREKPEKLTNCASNCPLERNLCSVVQTPQVQREMESHTRSRLPLNLQLSDTDDSETHNELHIESSDEKSPSDLSLTADTDKSMENLDILMAFGSSQVGSPDEKGKNVPIHLECRPKTFGLVKQQRVVKRASSEECITVVFDAEDGEPIEFSSHQTGVVTVTRNEISINQTPTGPNAENTELLPQGITHLQSGCSARDCTFLKRSEEETEKNIPKNSVDNVAVASTEPFTPKPMMQNTQQQKLTKPIHNLSCQSNSRSSVPHGIYPKQNLTKIPTRSKSSPQKTNLIEPEASTKLSSSDSVTVGRTPVLEPGKLSRGKKTENPGSLFDLQANSRIPKHPTQLPNGSKMSNRRNWLHCSKSQIPTPQVLSRPLTDSSDNGESLSRNKHCDPRPEAGLKSPSPPPPPGRSVSLLIRPRYDYLPLPSSAKSKPRAPSENVRMTFKSPHVKGSSGPVIPSNQTMTEQGKKSSIAFKRSVFAHHLPPTETVTETRCSAYTASNSYAAMARRAPKVSPKRGIPKIPLHQTLGTTQTMLQKPMNCCSMHEPLEISPSKSVSPGRKGQLNDGVSTSPQSFPGVHESQSSQVSSPSSSQLSKSCNTPTDCQNTHEKELKTCLPVGPKVLMTSPQLLRKSSTVPGKHEKDSLNEASKSSETVSKSKSEESRDSSSHETIGVERKYINPNLQSQENLTEGLSLRGSRSESLENRIPGTDGKDGVENMSAKTSLSSNKPHLKPALGMNGAKARSQSFSFRSGGRSSTFLVEGPGKVRTQIITNTAERGNSLTRQSSCVEGSPNKAPTSPVSDNLSNAGRTPGHPSYRQDSFESAGSSSSQHGSSSKLPLTVPAKTDEHLAPFGTEDQQTFTQDRCPSVAISEEPGSSNCRGPITPTDCPHGLQSSGRIQYLGNLERDRPYKTETSGKYPDTSTSRPGAMNPEASQTPTIEEKVMLCIQENLEKDQVQTKSISVDAKPKSGPSFASWFGFRRSRLPALSSRKMDLSKVKVEKKDTKGLAFGNKQLKLERKKDKKKPEQQCEIDNELNRGTESTDSPNSGLQSKSNRESPQDTCNQMTFESRSRPIPVTFSAEDTFMTELLNRVDKKAAQQTDSESNSVSYRSMLKGNPQGSCLTNSVSTQGNHKKSIKTKADMEIQKGSLVKETKEKLQEDEENTITGSSFQSHILESNCQMRTLDSGIGTFPLPDSGNRSVGRYICQADSLDDPEPNLSLQPAHCTASSIRAQTLEREVPSSIDSQRSGDKVIVHSTSDPVMAARGLQPLQSRLPKPAFSGKLTSQKQNETEPRPQTCSSFEYTENTMAKEQLPDWESEDKAAETQDKVTRMCTYSASGGSESDSDLDYGNNGFGAGRDKLVKTVKSTTQEIETS